ncbi:EthD domain-containing protein [Aromatoleum sp.]|uniref:EthD domain-containing protein n=1 Tax=Aromatoleum sp. TaxID=2307007 RepID=UPI002FCBDDFA
MLKVLSFLKRRDDFTVPAFSEYWRTTHKAHALTLVEAGFIRGYVQNHRVGDDPEADLPGLPLLADGAPELWVDDADALARLVSSREYLDGAGPDEANFVTPPVLAAVAREEIVVDGPLPLGAVKLILVARRKPSLAAPDFARRWLGPRRPGGTPNAVPLRLTRHIAVADDAPFDGAECTWWPDLDALHAAWSEADLAPLEPLIAGGSLRGMVVREDIVVALPVLEPAVD